MIELFYVSFLVALSYVTPPHGWMQFDQPFETKVECEQYINNNWESLQEVLQEQLTYQEIKSLQCMTKATVRELNTNFFRSSYPK
jgi:hypothetical protein